MNNALETTWEQQRHWSIAANHLKAAYYRWHRVVLVLLVCAALLETTSSQLGNAAVARILGGFGALVLAIVPVITHLKTGSGELKKWVGARSVSEELKSQVYFYLVQCGDFALGNRDEELVRHRAELLAGVDHSLVATVHSDGKEPPPITDVDSYLEQRLAGQIEYYRRAAAREQRTVTKNRQAQFALALAAAALGGAGAFLDATSIAAWVAVITTIAASMAAHVAAGRHEHLVISYGSTASRLESLKDNWRAGTRQDPCGFVEKCEATISSQNEGWMAQFLLKQGP